jgi:hypothetical protein
LHGIPGSGKTILSASILQDIFHCHPGHAITYFYFDFNDPEKQNFANFCRSIFHQLCHQYLAVPKDVESLYNLCKNTSRQPTILELSDTLSAAISEFPGCYIVLDALDECKERQNVVDLVCKLHSLESLPKVHIIITSRKERDIEISLMEFLSQENCLDLDSGVVDEDIRRYAYHCWENRPGFKRWRNNTALRIEVENALMQKAKGMSVP